MSLPPDQELIQLIDRANRLRLTFAEMRAQREALNEEIAYLVARSDALTDHSARLVDHATHIFGRRAMEHRRQR